MHSEKVVHVPLFRSKGNAFLLKEDSFFRNLTILAKNRYSTYTAQSHLPQIYTHFEAAGFR